MRDIITARIKYLCKLHDVPMPVLKINDSYLYSEFQSEIEYDFVYDTCTMTFAFGKGISDERIIEAIAHEFAHYITKEVGMLQSIIALDMNSRIGSKLFMRSAEKIAKRLEHIFIGEMETMQ